MNGWGERTGRDQALVLKARSRLAASTSLGAGETCRASAPQSRCTPELLGQTLCGGWGGAALRDSPAPPRRSGAGSLRPTGEEPGEPPCISRRKSKKADHKELRLDSELESHHEGKFIIRSNRKQL